MEVTNKQMTYPVKLKIITTNPIGMMRDITSHFAEKEINIDKLQVKTYKSENIAIINISI